ncbi:MAG TPA: cobalamin B12-binding domain-containing protein, partial [Thermoanaerobaculia bacterium]
VVATSVGGERMSLGALMLAELLRSEAWSVDVFTDLAAPELVRYIHEAQPDAIFVSCSRPERLEAGKSLLGELRAEFPDRMILAGGSAFTSDPAGAKLAGASHVQASLEEAKAVVMNEAKRRRKISLVG